MEITTEIPKLNGFSSLKNLEIPTKSGLMEEVGKAKIEALKRSILELKEAILERQKLSNEIIKEGEKIKSEINSYLSENERIQIGGADITKEKNDLRTKKIQISEMQLNEKITCWKDIALLKKELRVYEMQLNEKQDRVDLFTKLLEEN
jgi:nitrate/TMAO reductase-like tetraheme cytochrome c subunit